MALLAECLSKDDVCEDFRRSALCTCPVEACKNHVDVQHKALVGEGEGVRPAVPFSLSS